MIYGERFKQVRELNGWTQTDVAAAHGVTQPFVAQIENGWSKPPDEYVQSFIFRTGFPLRFFETPPETDFPLGSLLFRARAAMTEREQKVVHRHAQMAYEVLRRMIAGRAVNEIAVRVPNVPGDPERSAAIARSELGLSPDEPVKHLIHTMEAAGVLMIGLPRAFVGGDAFCAWALSNDGQRHPVVVLSSDRPADRVRHSSAHELGHLVMHQPLPSRPDVHAEADRFAGAFLLPADAMRQEISRATTLDTFLSIKVKWGISVQAAIMRAHQLELITPRKYRSLFQLLSARGWRTQEPLSNQVPLERPRAFRQIAETIYGTSRLDYAKIADDVQYPVTFVQELLEAHATKRSSVPPTPVHKNTEPETRKPGPLPFRRKG